MTTLFIRNSNPATAGRCGLLLIALACFALAPVVQAVSPPPDGGYPGSNTAEGTQALFSRTTGAWNTAIGFQALFHDTSGSSNTATGFKSLFSNTIGKENTATGVLALLNNTGGNFNIATGYQALLSNTTGANNLANGYQALNTNIDGNNNTAVGFQALLGNESGDFNTALGANAGTDPDIVSNNIYIGDPGFPGDTNVISIGGIAASGTDFENTYIGGIYGASVNNGTALPVYVDTDGHLGTTLVTASGQKVKIRAPNGAQPQAKLKEFQKQEKRIAELEATVARLAATVKEQAAQIQKVSAQVETSRPAARVVVNNQ